MICERGRIKLTLEKSPRTVIGCAMLFHLIVLYGFSPIRVI